MRSFIYNVLLMVLMMSSLFGFDDLDFDGVSDQKDQCPQSLFSDLVDKYGCKVSSVLLKKSHNFDIHTGVSSTRGDDYSEILNSVKLTYFYSNISLSFSNSYYQYDYLDYNFSIEGQEGYVFSLKYKYKLSNDINLNIKSEATIPSSGENNQKTDMLISLSSSYQVVNKLSISSGLTYTFMNSLDDKGVKYDNYHSFNIGSKYNITPNISLSYTQSTNSFKDTKDIKVLQLSTNYVFNNGIYSLIDIGQQFNDNPSISHSFKIGYFF